MKRQEETPLFQFNTCSHEVSLVFTTPKPPRATETTKRKETRETQRPAQLQDGCRGEKRRHKEKKADEKVAPRRNQQTKDWHALRAKSGARK